MAVTIEKERPDSDDAVTLINELESILAPNYPSESRHGFSVEKLIREQVAFFVIRQDEIPAGCGGVKIFGNEYGEVKRMYVRPQFRGLGLAKQILEHLTEFTRNQGISLLRLETGIHQVEAIALYEKMGFRSIDSFGEYTKDPLSRFYEKKIIE